MRTMCFCEYVWVVMNSYTEEMKGKTNMLTLDKFEEASEKRTRGFGREK